jgi:hypothetical protein
VLRAEHTPHLIRLSRAGRAGGASGHLLLEQRAAPDRRPYLHPIVAPDGAGVLTEDAPGHHTWQHGLYTGLNDVNGAGFWKQAHEDTQGKSGTIHPAPLTAPFLTRDDATWTVQSEWRALDRAPLLVETQRWTLRDRGADYLLDLEWTLRATRDLRFGQYAYGGLFFRMPYRAERGASALNSEGAGREGAEGQRACWVAVAMPIDGRPAEHAVAGVAVLDHPGNAEHPVPWRVDNQYGVSPSRCIAGEWRLAAGQSETARYRLVVFAGAIEAAAIEREWRRFAGSAV